MEVRRRFEIHFDDYWALQASVLHDDNVWFESGWLQVYEHNTLINLVLLLPKHLRN